MSSLKNVQPGITVEDIQKNLIKSFKETKWMPNAAEKISKETAAEIARVEDYLNSLRKLQIAIDPKPKKRKYTKRKKTLTPDSAPKRRPGRPKKELISPPMVIKSYAVETKVAAKKNRSRKKIV